MAAKGLDAAWRGAEKAKPSGWRLTGVVCGPRELDPKIHSAIEWCAWARGPNKERVTRHREALLELAIQLKGLSR